MPKAATVGCIKPTRTSGSHADLEKLLPDGIATLVRHFDIRHGTLQEFTEIMAGYQEAVRQHAEAGVDRKIRDAMARTQEATVAKVRDLVERGGRFSTAFGV